MPLHSFLIANARGAFADSQKRSSLLYLFSSNSYVFSFFSDTHLPIADIPFLKLKYKNSFWSSSPTSPMCGVGFILRDDVVVISTREKLFTIDQEHDRARALEVRIKLCSSSLRLIGIYAPAVPALRPLFFTALLAWLLEDGECLQDNVLLVGDFNCVVDPVRDRCPAHRYADRGTPELVQIIDTFALCDMWRKLHPLVQEHTYFAQSHSSRIDLVLASPGCEDWIRSMSLSPYFYLDHLTISFSLSPPSPLNSPPPPWHFDNRVLRDEHCLNYLRDAWKVAALSPHCARLSPTLKFMFCEAHLLLAAKHISLVHKRYISRKRSYL